MHRRYLKRAIFAILGIACFGFFVFMATVNFGLVQGEEFAPDTFERRTYWYFELPLVRLKITPVWQEVRIESLESKLVSDKLVPSSTPPKRWDLITVNRGAEQWRQGDARILSYYLNWIDEESTTPFWETWTDEHPKLAKILWPEIASLARQDLYFLIPPLFETALGHEKPNPLQNDLNRLLARSYEEVATAEAELEHWEIALRFFSSALEHQPDRATSLRGRAACHEELGETQKAP